MIETAARIGVQVFVGCWMLLVMLLALCSWAAGCCWLCCWHW